MSYEQLQGTCLVKGKAARNDHRKMHENMGTMYEAMLDQIPESTLDSMGQFLEAFDRALDDMDKSV